MASSAIDEAMRNAVAVGANPARIAILDNFCWGNTERPETLGSLVRAALACHDVAVAWKTPFISGKDSLNNEFAWFDADGEKQSIAIPPSLLISAIGQVDDVAKCVTMDFKEPGNAIYLVGSTKRELGGSHLFQVLDLHGGSVPEVDLSAAKTTFERLHSAIDAGLVRACHDLSEGGLAVALSEMSFAGQLGSEVDISDATSAADLRATEMLFSESNSRFLIEVDVSREAEIGELLSGVPLVRIGFVTSEDLVCIRNDKNTLVSLTWQTLFDAWHKSLDWS